MSECAKAYSDNRILFYNESRETYKMIKEKQEKKPIIEQAGEDLFDFAIDREDVKYLLTQLSMQTAAKPSTVEYELQILKIASVGWSISYLMDGTPKQKAQLLELFWQAVNVYSSDLSQTTGLMIGQDIDYFEILKARLDFYVNAMSESTDTADPTMVIGPAFAEQCGTADDIYASLAGAKMFNTAMNRVRRYLEAVKLR
jgi:hypothetical protein